MNTITDITFNSPNIGGLPPAFETVNVVSQSPEEPEAKKQRDR